MKITKEQMSELQYYIQEIRPDMVMKIREDNDEVIEFSDYGVVLYVAKVNVLIKNAETGESSTEKKKVYFLETHAMSIRKSTNFSDVCLAMLIYCTAEDLRIGFDLVKQNYFADHPVDGTVTRLQ